MPHIDHRASYMEKLPDAVFRPVATYFYSVAAFRQLFHTVLHRTCEHLCCQGRLSGALASRVDHLLCPAATCCGTILHDTPHGLTIHILQCLQERARNAEQEANDEPDHVRHGWYALSDRDILLSCCTRVCRQVWFFTAQRRFPARLYRQDRRRVESLGREPASRKTDK